MISVTQTVNGVQTVTGYIYDGHGHRVQETQNGSVVKQWVWCPGDTQPCEERDGSNNVTKRFYDFGEQINGTAYFTTLDHLGSVREMTDASGNLIARYDYDPFGRRTLVSGTDLADFGFTHFYYDQVSGLWFSRTRAYDPNLGRWLSRDPLEDAELSQGPNLYTYVFNDPLNNIDPLGLDTYEQNRQLGGNQLRSDYNPISHTFTFTTNPDGSLNNTYSWGNAGDTEGWHENAPEDRTAAQAAIDQANNGQLQLDRWGNQGLDPYVQQAFDQLNQPDNRHPNGIVTYNCKYEANKLIDLARKLYRAAQQK